MEMSQRKQNILAAICEAYIRTGEPVGSKFLAEYGGLGVSPATIRNEMAELFARGFLEQPHTSAGRVPSQRGLRLYLDSLMPHLPPERELCRYIDSLFNLRAVDMAGTLDEVTDAIANLTGCAVIAMAPTPAREVVERVEMLKVAPFQVVAVVITANERVYSKNFRLGYDISAGATEYFGNWLTRKMQGMELRQATRTFMQQTAMEAQENILLFTPLLAAVYELIGSLLKPASHISGHTNLFSYSELKPAVFDILKLIEDEGQLADLFRTIGQRRVSLGHESRHAALTEAAVILQEYRLPDGSGGVIGVIGPMRQDYRKILPALTYFADNLGKIFDEPARDDETVVREAFRERMRLEDLNKTM